MTRDEIRKLQDQKDNVLDVLTMAWLDADNGDWPLQNSLQRRAKIEWALRDYLKIKKD